MRLDDRRNNEGASDAIYALSSIPFVNCVSIIFVGCVNHVHKITNDMTSNSRPFRHSSQAKYSLGQTQLLHKDSKTKSMATLLVDALLCVKGLDIILSDVETFAKSA